MKLWIALWALLLLLPAAAQAQQPSGIGEVAAAALPAEARETIRLIRQGGSFPYERDGTFFGNYEKLLPHRSRGYYLEYTVKTPGVRSRGARRIVAGRGGELYYTDDHYKSFLRVREQDRIRSDWLVKRDWWIVTEEALFAPQQSGVYLAPDDLDALRSAASKSGISWLEPNLAGVGSKREFLTACAKSLRFPRSFGANWDALADCLKDLLADCVVNCRNCDAFAEGAPDDYATALEIFQDAAGFWADRGSTFVVLVDAEPDEVSLRRFPGS